MSLPPPPPPPGPVTPPVAWGARQPKPPRPRCPIGAALLVVGALVIVVGSLLPWFELLGDSYNGFQEIDDEGARDGPAFVALAVVLAGFGITTFAARRLLPIAILAVIVAAFSALTALADWVDVADTLGDVPATSVGPGLPVVVIGSLIALAGGIVALATRRRGPPRLPA